MPLVGYHLIGFEKGPVSFNGKDFSLLQRSEHRDRVERFYARSPHRFNLFFHNGIILRHGNSHGEMEQLQREWLLHGRLGGPVKHHVSWSLDEQHDKFLGGRTDLIDRSAVNIIYTNNATGTPEIPFTPHIMGHRTGHIHMLIQESGNLYDWLVNWAVRMLKLGYEYHPEKPDLYAWGGEPTLDAFWVNAIYKSLCTTRAGRNRQVMGWEYVPEWMAQWINKGKIIVPELPLVLDLPYIYQKDHAVQKPRISEGRLIRRYNYPTEMFAHAMAQRFDALMRKWTGEVIVT